MIPWLIFFTAVTQENVLQSQRASLTEAGIRPETALITIKGLSPEVVRAVRVRFPWSGLAKPAFATAETVLFWRGEGFFEDGKERPVWARVQIAVPRTGLVTVHPLRAGRRLRPDDVRISTWKASVFQSLPLQDIESVAGGVLDRSVTEGTPLLAEMVGSRDQILPGEHIAVESVAGDARVSFDAVAQNRAQVGERVFFRSPFNGKRVAGRSESGHRVVLSWEN